MTIVTVRDPWWRRVMLLQLVLSLHSLDRAAPVMLQDGPENPGGRWFGAVDVANSARLHMAYIIARVPHAFSLNAHEAAIRNLRVVGNSTHNWEERRLALHALLAARPATTNQDTPVHPSIDGAHSWHNPVVTTCPPQHNFSHALARCISGYTGKWQSLTVLPMHPRAPMGLPTVVVGSDFVSELYDSGETGDHGDDLDDFCAELDSDGGGGAELDSELDGVGVADSDGDGSEFMPANAGGENESSEHMHEDVDQDSVSNQHP